VQQHRRRNTHRDSHSNRIALGVVGAVVLLGAAVALYVAFRPNANATSSVSRQPQAPVSVAAGAEPTVAPAPKPLATPVRKPATKPATKVAVAAAPTPAPTLPGQMKRMLPGSTQIIVVTGAKLGSNTGTVYVFNKQGAHWVEKLRTATRMGTNGLINGAARHTNTLTTPTGIWKIGAFVFGKDARPPAGTLMPYRQITDGSWWSEEPNSTYNTWVESARPIQGEHLLGAASQQYEFALDAALEHGGQPGQFRDPRHVEPSAPVFGGAREHDARRNGAVRLELDAVGRFVGGHLEFDVHGMPLVRVCLPHHRSRR